MTRIKEIKNRHWKISYKRSRKISWMEQLLMKLSEKAVTMQQQHIYLSPNLPSSKDIKVVVKADNAIQIPKIKKIKSNRSMKISMLKLLLLLIRIYLLLLKNYLDKYLKILWTYQIIRK